MNRTPRLGTFLAQRLHAGLEATALAPAERIRVYGMTPVAVCCIEGDSGDAGGGDDPPAGDDPPSAPPPSGDDPPDDGAPPAAPAPGERTFTQEEVNRLVGQARAEGRRSAQVRQPAPQPPPSPADPPPKPADPPAKDPPPAASNDSTRLERIERDMFMATADALGVSESGAQRLYTMYQAEQPEDTKAWFRQLREDGIIPAAQNPAQPAKNQYVGPGGVKTPAPGGAPRKVSKFDQGGLVNIFNLSEEEAQSLTKEEILAHHQTMTKHWDQQDGRPPVPAALRKKG